MAEETNIQTPTGSPTRLPASAGYGGVYRLLNDDGQRWISKPDNGGDLGDMQDITDELNCLLDLLQRTHYRLIGKHGWGDSEAVLIGEAMGWDSGKKAIPPKCRTCFDHGSVEIGSGPYWRSCPDCSPPTDLSH